MRVLCEHCPFSFSLAGKFGHAETLRYFPLYGTGSASFFFSWFDGSVPRLNPLRVYIVVNIN